MPDLDTPLRRLIPTRYADRLAAEKDIHTAGELLDLVPRRFLDQHTELAGLRPGSYVVFVGTVVRAQTRQMRSRKQKMLTAVVSDGKEQLELTFFRAYGHDKALVPGAHGLFAGAVSSYQGRLQLAHPSYDLFPDDDDEAAQAAQRALMPVYPTVKLMPSWHIATAVSMVLDALGEIPDPLPADLRTRRELPDLTTAYRLAHLPETHEDRARARRRFAYDEALVLQLVLAQRRRTASRATTVPREPRPDGLLARFDAALPFELTAGQREVGAQIAADLARPHPMHRLLQGEVGSGKTIVALRAMLAVVDAGGQAALLAPTEVLATQHHRSITAMLGELAQGGLLGGAVDGTRVVLLTGSQSTAARKEALTLAATGVAGIVVGTHALIQDTVSFADLGLVVVDEQHRFGVEQRDALRGKAKQPPHLLVMTATPIPRTVAMTVFGDMETSTMTELPRGRSPIATHVVDNERWYDAALRRIADEVAGGHQVYVVCPRIGDGTDDSGEGWEAARTDGPVGRSPVAGGAGGPGEEPEVDDGDDDADDRDAGGGDAGDEAAPRALRSVLEVAEELRADPRLAGLRIGILHGRLPSEEKDAVMAAYTAGDLDVLVATTVIEVGVDVPNATLMIVMDADRFGVSQLHQLRGRIGRGSAPGLCLLVAADARETPQRPSDAPPPPPTPASVRLDALASTTDGFALSRVDLEQRREGDILGARQSGGRTHLRHNLRILRDEELILAAREDAVGLVDADPELATHPLLARAVAERVDETQAAYLERG